MEKHITPSLQTNASQLSFNETFVISGTAAIIAKTTAAPMERIKLLMQNQDKLIKHNRLDRQYSGIVDCAKHTLRNEGLLSFWRGKFMNNYYKYYLIKALKTLFSMKLRSIKWFENLNYFQVTL